MTIRFMLYRSNREPEEVVWRVPPGMTFKDIALTRDGHDGFSFSVDCIRALMAANGADSTDEAFQHQDTFASLIVGWYEAHLQAGGEPDPVAESSRLEAYMELIDPRWGNQEGLS